MNAEMGFLFAVLFGMAVLFFTEKLPVELTAFIGLVILTLGGYVTPNEAFTGFASPAVITMLSIFFVSGALLHTGVADVIAGRVHRTIGNRETLLIVSIMVVAGILSAFMNNIAAVAVLMPAVASICKKSDISPSRLFMPLSFGAILGGTTTLVGTPPNILAGELLSERGLEPFSLFDFTPIGAVLLGVGVVYMVTVGRWLLPKRTASEKSRSTEDLATVYHLQEQLFRVRIPPKSKLDGVTLGDARIGSILGIQVVGIIRNGRKQLAPGPDEILHGDDVLLIKGPFEPLRELLQGEGVVIGDPNPDELHEALRHVDCVCARVSKGASFVGKTLRDIHFRERFGAVVIGIRRNETLIDGDLGSVVLGEGDELLGVGTQRQIDHLALPSDLEIIGRDPSHLSALESRLFLLRIHAGSPFVGTSIRESRLGETVGLTVAGIIRDQQTLMAVRPKERILPGDQLLVAGETEAIRALVALGDVQLQQELSDTGLRSDEVGIVEVTPAPRSRAVGMTLAEVDFREKTGLQVLAIWTQGRALHIELVSHRIRVGDALLVQGSWQKIHMLGSHPDFVVLNPSAQERRRTKKAPVAVGALLVMIGMVATGYMPIHVAAFTAATLVALFGAVTMEEAYRSVEWKAVFLVAAILPAGIAIERTGAAALAAGGVAALSDPLGQYGVLGGIVALASALSQCLDGAPSVVLMAPVVMPLAESLGMSTHAVMMAVALAASAAFMTPFSHKANLLVMGAGGYRVVDYLRVGTPLTLVLLLLMVVLTPVFFPF